MNKLDEILLLVFIAALTFSLSFVVWIQWSMRDFPYIMENGQFRWVFILNDFIKQMFGG